MEGTGAATVLTIVLLMVVLAAAGVLLWSEFTDAGHGSVKEALVGAQGETKRLADAQARREQDTEQAWEDEAKDNATLRSVLGDIVDEQARDYEVMKGILDATGVSRSVLTKMESKATTPTVTDQGNDK